MYFKKESHYTKGLNLVLQTCSWLSNANLMQGFLLKCNLQYKAKLTIAMRLY